jgi:hypothetical protein
VLLGESLALFRELKDPLYLAVVLHNLGYVALNQGDSVQGAARFVESLTLWRELASLGGIAGCCLGLGGVAGAQQQSEWAARLFGAAEALFHAGEFVVDPADRNDYDRYVAAARAQLDEPTFAAARDAGRTMTLEQVVAYALEPTPAEYKKERAGGQ